MKYNIILILTLLTHMVYSQDSVLVNETCMKLHAMKNSDDFEKKLEIITDDIKKYVPDMTSVSSKQEVIQAYNRYSYKFFRELRRTCSEFEGEPVTLKFNVIDIENKLKDTEIDSLIRIIKSIQNEKKIYIHIMTIDDYFPFKTINDFADKYRINWSSETKFTNGTLFIVISSTKREIKLSTNEIAMKYLTDNECAEIIELMKPNLTQNKYFEGLVKGINQIRIKK